MKRTPLKRKTPMKCGNAATKNLENDKRPWKRTDRLAKVSPERKEQLQDYFEASKIARANDTTCQRCRKHCAALDIHHPYGRRSHHNLMRFILLCRSCHEWVHGHSNEAFLQGWLQPEYKGYPRHPDITFPVPWERAYGPDNPPAWVIVPRKVRTPQNATLEANHDSIDWSQPVKVTAALLNLSITTVTSYMQRKGIPMPSRQKRLHAIQERSPRDPISPVCPLAHEPHPGPAMCPMCGSPATIPPLPHLPGLPGSGAAEGQGLQTDC